MKILLESLFVDLFVSFSHLQGCTLGKHSNEKPAEVQPEKKSKDTSDRTNNIQSTVVLQFKNIIEVTYRICTCTPFLIGRCI